MKRENRKKNLRQRLESKLATFPNFPPFATLSSEDGRIRALCYCLDVRQWKIELEEMLENEV